jgi:CMP-N,N'-diacetyllegionaminic acid synthase
MVKNLVAVIPVRKGSQRVKNKNFKKFDKKNLLIHKIEILKKIKEIDEIIINTDSEKAIKIAKEFNVSFHKREKYYASSNCSNSNFWANIAKETNSKFIMFTNCTSPLIKLKTYKNFIKDFYKFKKKYDSFNTVTNSYDYLYYKKKPINFNPKKTPNSQDLPEILKINFAINILSKDYMFKNKTLLGENPYFFKINEVEGFDINTPLEFNFAEHQFKKKNY